jgi:homoserine dehydrogenase
MQEIQIGLLGAGVVGGGTLQALAQKGDRIAAALGCRLRVKRVLVRDPEKTREVPVDPALLTTCPEDILDDPAVQIVVELIGGEEPARSYIARALEQGKHVVTANKEVIAKHGFALLALAQKRRVNLFYEASVGGGIPIIAVLRRDLVANEISQIQAIINGTTNFILTEMEQGRDYAEALRHAQRLGYAEPDPRNDVEGIDAAYKLAILATLAFRTNVRPEDIPRTGITGLHAKDFRYAREMGYVIKLLATARRLDGEIEAAVHPALLPLDHHLASVKGVFNAVLIDGDQIDKLMLYGRGAGARPTSSAVLADICAVAQSILRGTPEPIDLRTDGARLRDFGEVESRFYLRMQVADQPGVLAQIARVLGDARISIASVIQKETDESARSAEIVLMTHLAKERRMAEALEQIRTLPVVRQVSSFIRVAK